MGFDDFSEQVIGSAIEVHRELGPGLLESVYEECLADELSFKGIPYERQVSLPIHYKGKLLKENCFRVDLLVANKLIIEIKAIDRVVALHEAQLLTYLRLTGIKSGLLLNFNAPTLKDGLKRMVL